MLGIKVGRSFANRLRQIWKCGHRLASTDIAVRHLPSPGKQIYGYTVESVIPVPEFSLTAVLLHHRTGAQHLHIARDDSDNVFGVAFRTTPLDSTGVPHILEHLTLCGSDKFPVRDPFFKMYARSLATFMNAFTASDWTMYPFSTQNFLDYENLMSVYLDAVFSPRLRKQDFSQEGWRLEHENPEDSSTPIIFKGVVFNEMKGAFSNAQQLFAEKNQNLILPSHTYGVVSGGDPLHIPDLTWENLRAFHKKYYHPSNSRFYTYGNFPLERHLELIEEQALKKFSSIPVDTSVPKEQRWSSPREAHITCQLDPLSPDPEKSTTVAVSYLLSDITDVLEACALSILGTLLVDGEKSPFYQELLESGIGADYAPVVGYNGYTRESTFAIGLQRIHRNDVEKVKDIIEATFSKVIENGFDSKQIEAILHKIELGQKHQSAKFGLNLGIGLLPCWTHDGDPLLLIQVNRQVEWFKDQLKKNPKYLQEMVRKYFKENSHKLTLVMSPDEQFDKIYQEKEDAKLNEMLGKLSDKEKKNLFDLGKELADVQSLKEDISCLPTLRIEDIDRQLKPVKTTDIISNGTSVQLCIQPTNGVTYFRAISNIASLPQHLKPYVPLFCGVATKLGAGSRNYKDLSEEIDLKTGGLGVSAHLTEHHQRKDLFEQSILFSSYCLDRNTSDMFDLWSDIFNRVLFSDTNRLRTLVMITAAEISGSLADTAHRYAMTYSGAMLSPCSALKEEMFGIAQLILMKKLAEMSEFDLIMTYLKDIADRILTRDVMRCSINAMPESIDSAATSTEKFLQSLNHSSSRTSEDSLKFFGKDDDYQSKTGQIHFEFPFQVQYIAKSLPAVPFSHPDYASLQILAKLMTTQFLHREIREKGGAYGGGAVSSSNLFHFFSYRDPNLQRTLDTFNEGSNWAVSGDVSQQEISEAKLSVFAQVDSPVPPGSKGMRKFLYGINDETYSTYRHQLLDVTKDDLVRVAKKYLKNDTNAVTVLGPSNSVTGNSPQWTVKRQD